MVQDAKTGRYLASPTSYQAIKPDPQDVLGPSNALSLVNPTNTSRFWQLASRSQLFFCTIHRALLNFNMSAPVRLVRVQAAVNTDDFVIHVSCFHHPEHSFRDFIRSTETPNRDAYVIARKPKNLGNMDGPPTLGHLVGAFG
ncbi:MAG: hypothetical protein Q9157_001685 [Trypethelium eluteriae]